MGDGLLAPDAVKDNTIISSLIPCRSARQGIFLFRSAEAGGDSYDSANLIVYISGSLSLSRLGRFLSAQNSLPKPDPDRDSDFDFGHVSSMCGGIIKGRRAYLPKVSMSELRMGLGRMTALVLALSGR